jgi:hypothetical protein
MNFCSQSRINRNHQQVDASDAGYLTCQPGRRIGSTQLQTLVLKAHRGSRRPAAAGTLTPMAISRGELIKILAQADPVGLIANGSPKTEYAREADAILELEGAVTLTEITGVFTVSFSEPGACSRETARWIAEEMVRRDGSR